MAVFILESQQIICGNKHSLFIKPVTTIKGQSLSRATIDTQFETVIGTIIVFKIQSGPLETMELLEILLMFSTALKEIAVELNICMFTSTQVNANADSNANIRNESSIAGSRAVINKADVGMVMARPTKEELDFFTQLGREIPNIVTDIYKVRSGEYNQVRIWSYVDLGTLRKKDLYMTDSRMEVIDQYERNFKYEIDWERTNFKEQLSILEGIQ